MSLIESWIYALWKELHNHKGKVAIGFAVVTFVVLAAGFLWPKKYEASAIVFADEQNIIKPLLSGSAEVTKPDIDQAAIAKDRILSNRSLGQALVGAKWIKSTDDPAADALMRSIRGGIVVTDAGRGHLKIAYQAADANSAFTIASALTNAFIRDSAQTKSQESREAFTFIDNQVKTYKEQLQAAEEKLKTFKGESGVLSGGAGQISQLRSSLSQLTLDLQVARARRDEFRRQLSQEKQFVNKQYRSDTFRQRLTQAQSQLDTLRLSYSDTYPDIVSLKQQIQDLQKAISDTENQEATEQDSSGGGANPVYAKLRGDLADAEVSVRGLELKVAAVNKMLGDEQGYSKVGAEYDAQLAELTRDYTVTKQMYESMLERKERARLSVALDVEGQGVSYKIKEPPTYPKQPVGLRFVHFFLLAPILGFIVPLALLVAYIQLDQRLRFLDKLEFALPETVTVLAAIPHMTTVSERRAHRGEWLSLGIFAIAVLLIYVAVGLMRIGGFI